MVLHNKSPFEVLFGHLPDYHSLKVFGCVCYPYLRPYNPHKLHFHTSPCLFLSYSSCHKGYKCLHPSGRLYISPSVTFDETRFLYLELFHLPTPTSLSSTNTNPSAHFPSPSLFSFPSQTTSTFVPPYPSTTLQNPNPSNSSNLFVPSANTPSSYRNTFSISTALTSFLAYFFLFKVFPSSFLHSTSNHCTNLLYTPM